MTISPLGCVLDCFVVIVIAMDPEGAYEFYVTVITKTICLLFAFEGSAVHSVIRFVGCFHSQVQLDARVSIGGGFSSAGVLSSPTR